MATDESAVSQDKDDDDDDTGEFEPESVTIQTALTHLTAMRLKQLCSLARILK